MRRAESYIERSALTRAESGTFLQSNTEATRHTGALKRLGSKKEMSVVDRLYGVGMMKTKRFIPENTAEGEQTAKLKEEFEGIIFLLPAFSKQYHFNDMEQRKYRMHKFIFEKVPYSDCRRSWAR